MSPKHERAAAGSPNELPRSELILAKAFCQVDTVRGFRYLDDAGKVMNSYADIYGEMNVGVNGLSMTSPKTATPVDEIRVSSTQIWMSFTHPASARLVAQYANDQILAIAHTISVSAGKRFGLRTHRLVTVASSEQAAGLAVKLLPDWTRPRGGSSLDFELSMRTRVGARDVTVRLTPVARADAATDEWIPSHALLIDIDIYKSATEIPLADLGAFLEDATDLATAVAERAAADVGELLA